MGDDEYENGNDSLSKPKREHKHSDMEDFESIEDTNEDNFEDYYMKPCKVDAMMLSQDKTGQISLRHPKLLEIRDDIDINDCTLSKIVGKE